MNTIGNDLDTISKRNINRIDFLFKSFSVVLGFPFSFLPSYENEVCPVIVILNLSLFNPTLNKIWGGIHHPPPYKVGLSGHICPFNTFQISLKFHKSCVKGTRIGVTLSWKWILRLSHVSSSGPKLDKYNWIGLIKSLISQYRNQFPCSSDLISLVSMSIILLQTTEQWMMSLSVTLSPCYNNNPSLSGLWQWYFY